MPGSDSDDGGAGADGDGDAEATFKDARATGRRGDGTGAVTAGARGPRGPAGLEPGPQGAGPQHGGVHGGVHGAVAAAAAAHYGFFMVELDPTDAAVLATATARLDGFWAGDASTKQAAIGNSKLGYKR